MSPRLTFYSGSDSTLMRRQRCRQTFESGTGVEMAAPAKPKRRAPATVAARAAAHAAATPAPKAPTPKVPTPKAPAPTPKVPTPKAPAPTPGSAGRPPEGKNEHPAKLTQIKYIDDNANYLDQKAKLAILSMAMQSEKVQLEESSMGVNLNLDKIAVADPDLLWRIYNVVCARMKYLNTPQ